MARPKNKLSKDEARPGALARRIVARWGEAGGDVPLDRVISELGDVQRYDIVASLKELERAGAGEFLVGRAGRKARFVWSRGRANVLREEARKEPQDATAIAKSRRGTTKPRPVSTAKPVQLEHVFHLRSDVVVSVALPSDITSTEMERLCQFLRAIPFDGERAR